MAIYNKRLEFTKEKLIEHYHKRDTLPDFIYGIVRFIGIIIQNIYCVSSYLVLSWIILFPISWVRSDLYSKAENYLYNSLLFIVSSWSLAAGANIVETGEEYKHLIEEPETYAIGNRPNGKQANGYQRKAINQFQNRRIKFSKDDEFIRSTLNTSDTSFGSIRNNKQSGDQTTNLNELEKDLKQRNDNVAVTKTFHNNNNNNEKSSTINSIASWTNQPLLQSGNSSGYQLLRSLNNSLSSQPTKPRILLLCNHISTADVPLMMQSFSTLTNQSILWVLDAQFKPTNFGLVCSSHGDFFIAKDSFKDGSLKEQVLRHPDRNLLVLFPEGGFWRKRLDGSNRYALRNGLPLTRYVTHPRFGAFKDLIDPSVGITHIVDATLLYDDIKNPLSILDIALGTRKEPAILNYKVYKRSEINPNEEWLRSIWLEKDKLLEQYYEDRGSFYKLFEGSMRSAKLDWFKLLSVHLFYLLVCYLTVYRLFSAASVTMLRARDLYYSNI